MKETSFKSPSPDKPDLEPGVQKDRVTHYILPEHHPCLHLLTLARKNLTTNEAQSAQGPAQPATCSSSKTENKVCVCEREESNAGFVSLQGKPESALFPPAAYRSVTTASEEQSAHTSHLPTTQFLHPSPPHPKARPRLRTRSGSLTTAAARSPLEKHVLCAFKCPTTSFNGNPPSTGPRRSSPPPNSNPQTAVRAPRTVQPQPSRPSTPRPRRRQATGSPRPPAPPSPP